MEKLGEPVLKPFLQDVIQLGPLVRSLAKQARAASQRVWRARCWSTFWAAGSRAAAGLPAG